MLLEENIHSNKTQEEEIKQVIHEEIKKPIYKTTSRITMKGEYNTMPGKVTVFNQTQQFRHFLEKSNSPELLAKFDKTKSITKLKLYRLWRIYHILPNIQFTTKVAKEAVGKIDINVSPTGVGRFLYMLCQANLLRREENPKSITSFFFSKIFEPDLSEVEVAEHLTEQMNNIFAYDEPAKGDIAKVTRRIVRVKKVEPETVPEVPEVVPEPEPELKHEVPSVIKARKELAEMSLFIGKILDLSGTIILLTDQITLKDLTNLYFAVKGEE